MTSLSLTNKKVLLLALTLFGAGWASGSSSHFVQTSQNEQSVKGTMTQSPEKHVTIAPSPTAIPSPTEEPSPTEAPTNTPIPYTPKPTKRPVYVPPTTPPQNIAPPNNAGGFSCNCAKTCPQMVSCSEAYYQLNTCGCSARDGDSDGVPCESICR